MTRIARTSAGGRRILGGESAALEQGAMIGPAATASASVAGKGQQHRQLGRAALDGRGLRRPRREPMWRLIAGRIAVPSAEPMSASGSWFSRSA